MQRKAFDATIFASLVALLDAPQDREADGALYRIREALKKSGKRFYEVIETHEYKSAAWEVFGHPECLNPQANADTVSEYEATNAALLLRIADLEKASPTNQSSTSPAPNCQPRRWWHAIILATALAFALKAALQ